MLAYVGLMLKHVEPKDPKNGNSKKKHCKTQDILMVDGRSWAYVGPSWGYVGLSSGYVGPSWGYLGPSRGYVGPSWSYVGPSWGYVGPSWGLCCPILGQCLPILRPILAHVDPSQTTRSEKGGKMRRAQNTVKRDSFWRAKVSAAGGAAPLSYGEKRTAVWECHGQGAPGRIYIYIYIYIYI